MGVTEILNPYFPESGDPRTNDWFLVGSLVPLTGILITYVYLVLKVGPSFMKNRKPYSLKGFIKLYNIFQIIANSLIVLSILQTGRFTISSLKCIPVDYSDDTMSLTRIFWFNYMVKIIDLIETIVFVLRKKQRQVSFLHLYHHVTTVLIAWYTTKYTPGGMCIFPMILNCSVHIIMYSYYFSSSLNSPTINALIRPIKRYITIIQLVQFVALLIHITQTFHPRCVHYQVFGPIFSVNVMMNFILFLNFYRKNYTKKSTQKKVQ